MRSFVFVILCLSLTGCNSIYMKPGTMNTEQMIYSPRGGYSMQRSIKEVMENRGYNVSVGKLVRVSEVSGSETYQIPKDAKYAVNVKERSEKLRPIWCIFNGFWWWSFNVSIIDRSNNNEILTWRGRGCANSSLRKLNNILDELEIKDKPVNETPKRKKSVKKVKESNELLILAPKN